MKHIISIHHYLGTFFFGLFLIWFLSGFVMMYKSFPTLNEEERIFGNESAFITPEKAVHPAEVFPELKNEGIDKFRINTISGALVYHIITQNGALVSKTVKNNKPFELNKPKALKIAQGFTGTTENGSVRVLNEVDQWIPRPKFIPYLPAYKVALLDDNNTFVYISSKTGEILNKTTTNDRFWAWVGAIPHWIYFKNIRIHGSFWSQLICWLSALGFVMALTGILTGIVRYRKKPNANFKRFKNKWYNFHYYFGLIFGLFVCSWVFSGFMSMSPFNWAPSSSLTTEESNLWQGTSLTLNTITENEWDNFTSTLLQTSVKEIQFSRFDNKLFSEKHTEKGAVFNCLSTIGYYPVSSDFKKKINAFDTLNPVEEISLLKEYDNYYYDRSAKKQLPIVKAITENGTVYYIEPKSTKVVQKSNSKNRLERWLYHGLHSLDFSFLTQNRPLWDIVMILLLLGGTVVSVTATGLGIKFMRRKTRKYLKFTKHG